MPRTLSGLCKQDYQCLLIVDMPGIDFVPLKIGAYSVLEPCPATNKQHLADAEYQPFPVRFTPAIVPIWSLPSSSLTLPGLQMNRNDLRRVDLNLLIVFETLMHERSVTLSLIHI